MRDYLPLADTVGSVAMNFMAKAFNLTDDEQAYIFSNTEIDEAISEIS